MSQVQNYIEKRKQKSEEFGQLVENEQAKLEVDLKQNEAKKEY